MGDAAPNARAHRDSNSDREADGGHRGQPDSGERAGTTAAYSAAEDRAGDVVRAGTRIDEKLDQGLVLVDRLQSHFHGPRRRYVVLPGTEAGSPCQLRGPVDRRPILQDPDPSSNRLQQTGGDEKLVDLSRQGPRITIDDP